MTATPLVPGPTAPVREKVANVEAYDFPWEEADGSLLAFYDWVRKQIEAIPVEYRGVAEIDFTASGYDDATVWITVYYDRPQTEAEIAADAREKAANAEAEYLRAVRYADYLKGKLDGR